MKHLKQTMLLMLTFALIASILTIPALAVKDPLASQIKKFQPIRQADVGRYPGYTKTLQRFLMSYYDTGDSFVRLKNAGGTDGIFGSVTDDITKDYQTDKKLVADGWVGTATWGAIADDLGYYVTSQYYSILECNDHSVLFIDYTQPSYSYVFSPYEDTGKQGAEFRWV